MHSSSLTYAKIDIDLAFHSSWELAEFAVAVAFAVVVFAFAVAFVVGVNDAANVAVGVVVKCVLN